MKLALLGAAAAALLALPAPADLYTSGVPQVPISSSAVAVKTLAVGDSFAVHDVNVIVRLEHAAVGELRLRLLHPDGTSVDLSTGQGAHAGFVLTTFDDEAAATLASGTPPFQGTFRPASPLSVLDGKSPTGTWTLEVTDVTPGNDGWLFGFCVAFNGATYVSGNSDTVMWSLHDTATSLGVPDAFAIADIEVALDLTHACPADLSARLTDPAGATANFLEAMGCWFDTTLRLVCLDDQAPLPIALPQPFTGRWRTNSYFTPGAAFQPFDGHSSLGNWTLSIYDGDMGDEGTFHAWALHLTPTEVCFGSAPASATSYGSGTSGTLGFPTLTASALPVVGSSFAIEVGSSTGTAGQGALLLGAAPTALPILGGTLLVADPALFPIAIPASGASIPVTLHPGAFECGKRFYLQSAQLDVLAPAFFSFSAGLELVLGS